MTKPNHTFTVEKMKDYIRKNKLNKAPVLLKMNRNDMINALKKINHFDDIGKPRKTPVYNQPKNKPVKKADKDTVKKVAPKKEAPKKADKDTVKKVAPKKEVPKKADKDTLPYLASDPFDAISSKFKGNDLSKLPAKTITGIVDIIKSSGYKISTSQIKKMGELWNNPLYKSAEFRHIKGTNAKDKKLGNKGLVLTFFRQNYSQKEFKNPRLQFAIK